MCPFFVLFFSLALDWEMFEFMIFLGVTNREGLNHTTTMDGV